MKQLYEIGEMPELGVVPEKMRAWVIRPDRHGNPIEAFKDEVVDTPRLAGNEVLVMVMSAGMNFNGVWSALGKPVSPCLLHKEPFHIAGSDAAGIVWQIGSALENDKSFKFKVGDEVVVHGAQFCGKCFKCISGKQVHCINGKAWGYETSYGSFAQFAKVQATQLMSKPAHLGWAEAGGYLLTAATAWQMLYGFDPNTVKPGSSVLVFGGAGGVGSYIIQLAKLGGAKVVSVVSSDERGEYCKSLGADGFINRRKFDCWGRLPEVNGPEYRDYLKKVRKFGSAVWEILGENVNPDIVVDFIGESTFPVSVYLADKGGMVISCGATSGFLINYDASYLWMRQKRIQGSHFCSFEGVEQLQQLIMDKRIECTLSKVYDWQDGALAHEQLYQGEKTIGNVSILVQAKKGG